MFRLTQNKVLLWGRPQQELAQGSAGRWRHWNSDLCTQVPTQVEGSKQFGSAPASAGCWALQWCMCCAISLVCKPSRSRMKRRHQLVLLEAKCKSCVEGAGFTCLQFLPIIRGSWSHITDPHGVCYREPSALGQGLPPPPYLWSSALGGTYLAGTRDEKGRPLVAGSTPVVTAWPLGQSSY